MMILLMIILILILMIDLLHITISKEDKRRLSTQLKRNLLKVRVRARPVHYRHCHDLYHHSDHDPCDHHLDGDPDDDIVDKPDDAVADNETS